MLVSSSDLSEEKRPTKDYSAIKKALLVANFMTGTKTIMDENGKVR